MAAIQPPQFHSLNVVIVGQQPPSKPPTIVNHQQMVATDSDTVNKSTVGSTNDFNTQLIGMVRKNPCLYDSNDKQYRMGDHKLKIWNQMCAVLRFDGDARTLYNRWKQLRDKYGKEKKKIRHNNEHSSWPYFVLLEFLEPHMIDRSSSKFENGKEDSVIINDPNFALNLINEVRRHPCLYDVKDQKYRHIEYRTQAWTGIIKDLGFPGDITAIYKQWKKIRDRYVREKRKIRMSTGGSQLQDGTTWELFNEMVWIDPFLDERLASQMRRKRDASEISGDNDFYADEPTMTFPTSLNSSSESLQNHDSLQQQPQHQYANQNQIPVRSVLRIEGLPASTNAIQQSMKIQSTSVSSDHNTMQRQQINSTIIPQNDIAANCHRVAALPQPLLISNSGVLEGDQAFAISVAADLLTLPERDRNMARAQIQHLLENSKITIVKA